MNNNKDYINACLTWVNNDFNCGQTLQAFSLQYALSKKEKISSILIDYKYVSYNSSFLKPHIFEVYRILRALKNGKMRDLFIFDRFVKDKIDLVGPFFSREEVDSFLRKENIPSVVLGGDQIWNPQAGSIPDVMLLLIDGINKYAYSPSMCSYNDKNIYMDDIKRLVNALSDYKYVGVRESTAKKMITDFCEMDVSVNLDPVFLLNEEEWICETVPYRVKDLEKDSYIFVCIYGELYKEVIELVDRVSSIDKKLKIVFYGKDYTDYIPAKWIKRKTVGPGQFVQIIANAQCIITDSFHATSFSIIFKKTFYVFPSKRKGFVSNTDRVTDVLERFKLSDRLFDGGELRSVRYDYNKSDEVIENNYINFTTMCEMIRNSALSQNQTRDLNS